MGTHQMESTRKIWHLLTRYEARDLIARAFQRLHDTEPSEKRVGEVAANFIQGREYFSNAGQAALTVRPLLQYYGVASLSRGLILLLANEEIVRPLTSSHGLTTKGWQPLLDKGLANLINLSVQVGKGLFYDLLRFTDNKTYLRAASSGIDFSTSADLPPEGSRFSLRDVASSLPDVSADFALATGTPFMSIPMEGFTNDKESGNYLLRTYSRIEDAVIQAMFEPHLLDITKANSQKHVKFTSLERIRCGQVSKAFFGTIGQVHIVPAMSETVVVNDLGLYFAASFILGNVVRYYPATWVALSRQVEGDAIFPLVNKFVTLIDEIYPALIFEFLEGPYGFEDVTSTS